MVTGCPRVTKLPYSQYTFGNKYRDSKETRIFTEKLTVPICELVSLELIFKIWTQKKNSGVKNNFLNGCVRKSKSIK